MVIIRKLNTELYGLYLNLRNALLLMCFRRVANENFRVSNDQIMFLLLMYISLAFFFSYFQSLPKPEFSSFGFAGVSVQFILLALLSYLISRVSGSGSLQNLLVVFLSLWTCFYVLWAVVGTGENFSRWALYGEGRILYLLFNVWMLAVFVRAALGKLNPKHVVLVAVAYMGVILWPLHNITLGSFWYQSYDAVQENKYGHINQEDTYYHQFDFLQSIEQSTLPERPGISDIYFVGFGSYADQDVFMKEVQYARGLFDQRFDTQGRSIALINNAKTVANVPMASGHNLGRVLKHVGSIINRDEDILFLYLTSHGSREHKLAVDFASFGLNDIDPDSLKRMLDDSGIKYRVLLVSACYSGGFVEPLKNEFTLVMTASAADRQSFGCGNRNEFTYFGKAVFDEQLRANYNFIDAFKKSIITIRQREKRGRQTPSNPQLFVGSRIRPKLEQLSRELESL